MKTSYRIIIPLLIGSLLSGCTPNDNIDPDDSNVYCEQAYPGSTGETVELTISGETITCAKINEEYIFQGDILLQTPTRGAVYAEGDLWPNNTVYYTINSNLPDKERVTQAIEYYHTYTNLTFIERTNQSNYIDFIYDANGCSSYLGMIGGRQPIRLANWGTKGNVIHEIGHAIGLLHEHSKVGRDQYVNIIEENIQNGTQHNFTEFSSSNPNTNGFDFESIMLYSSYAFSKNGKATIVKKNGEVFNTQRSRLSEDDLEIINEIYPGKPTGVKFTDSRDGKVYKTVIIGEQVWMAENLAYLPVVSPSYTISMKDRHYYVYDYKGIDVNTARATDNYQTYGVLYNWPAAMEACPSGWHLPSDAEWTELINYLGGELVAGNKMKETGTSHWGTTGGTNESGFTALPSGGLTGSGFGLMRSFAFFWSSTIKENYCPNLWNVCYGPGVGNTSQSKLLAYSVRCIKDKNSPIVTTGVVTNITMSTATCSCAVNLETGLDVSTRGVCWSRSQNPTISNSITTNGAGTGTFIGNITGLYPHKTYYVRAYATSSAGTVYGEQRTFMTLQEEGSSTFIDNRDGETYKMVTIGDQTWMAENMAYLPAVNPAYSTSFTNNYYYVYGYEGTDVGLAKSTVDYSTYGVLYNWLAAMKACPSGWHLPSDTEWTELIDYLGGELIAGGKMKETGTSHWTSPNTGATNESGFTALPGGYRSTVPYFIGVYGIFYSSTEYSDGCAWYWSLAYDNSNVNRNYDYKDCGRSIRCVRD